MNGKALRSERRRLRLRSWHSGRDEAPIFGVQALELAVAEHVVRAPFAGAARAVHSVCWGVSGEPNGARPERSAVRPAASSSPFRDGRLSESVKKRLAPEALTTPSAPGRARENLPLGRLLPTRPIYLAQWSQGLSNPRVLSPPHRMARLGSHTYPSGEASAELISPSAERMNAPTGM